MKTEKETFRGYCEICKKWINYITLRQLKTKAYIKCPQCKKEERVKL